MRGETQRGKEETGRKPEHRVSKAQAPLPTQSSWEEAQEGQAHAHAHWWLTPFAWHHFTTRCQAGNKMAAATAVLTGEHTPITGVRARGQALHFRDAHTARRLYEAHTPPQQHLFTKRTARCLQPGPSELLERTAFIQHLVSLSRAREAAWVLSAACAPIRPHHRAIVATLVCQVQMFA